MSTVEQQIDQVAQFMKVAGQAVNTKETPVSLGVARLRYNLIIEEILGKNEFAYCAERDDMVGMLDGMCDILYVVYGAALTFGVDIASSVIAPNKAAGKLAPAHRTLKTIHDMEYDANQFVRGYETDDYNLIKDSLINIVKQVYSYAGLINVDLSGAFDEVHSSNMSKFSDTQEHAQTSVETRRLKGDEKYANVYVASVNVEGVDYWMIKRKDDHKILKSLNFFEPDLSKFVK